MQVKEPLAKDSTTQVVSPYQQIDTPVLLIDREKLMDNLRWMQEKADRWGVKLRPHTKTHKMPELAKIQWDLGACGITVAKVGEAETMAEYGLDDIFIANEIVGDAKWRRVARLSKWCHVIFGVDSPEAVEGMERVFAEEDATALVRIEIEVGEERSGVVTEAQFDAVLQAIAAAPHVQLEGVFSHEGHSYTAQTVEACLTLTEVALKRTLDFADRARQAGFELETVSIGSTPSLAHCEHLMDGITEIRPGTYVFMDVSQGNCIGTYDRCAATVLTTIISKPTEERLIGDAGAKALTAQSRDTGLCHAEGKGYIKGSGTIYADDVYDEHTIIYSRTLRETLKIGDKIELIPNHICPVVNLYDQAVLVSDGQAVGTLDIACRGKLR